MSFSFNQNVAFKRTNKTNKGLDFNRVPVFWTVFTSRANSYSHARHMLFLKIVSKPNLAQLCHFYWLNKYQPCSDLRENPPPHHQARLCATGCRTTSESGPESPVKRRPSWANRGLGAERCGAHGVPVGSPCLQSPVRNIDSQRRSFCPHCSEPWVVSWVTKLKGTGEGNEIAHDYNVR